MPQEKVVKNLEAPFVLSCHQHLGSTEPRSVPAQDGNRRGVREIIVVIAAARVAAAWIKATAPATACWPVGIDQDVDVWYMGDQRVKDRPVVALGC